MPLALSDSSIRLIINFAERVPADRRIDFVAAAAHELWPRLNPSYEEVYAALQTASRRFHSEMVALQ